MQFGKRRQRLGFVSTGQDFQQREAVIDRTMPVVEEARLPDQVAEFGPLKAACGPVDLSIRAGPGLVGKNRRKGLAEWPIEPAL